MISKRHPFQREFPHKEFKDTQRQKTGRKLINIKQDKVHPRENIVGSHKIPPKEV
jgi:hypothetical protein